MEKILIRGVNWLGDAVMSLPAVRAVRKLHPNSNISLLVKKKIAELYRLEDSIDEVILYKEGVIGKFKTIKELKKRGFKRVYLLQNAFDAALIVSLAGIPERVGWNRDCRRFLLTHPVSYNAEDRKIHHIDYFFKIPKSLNPSLILEYPWINLPLKERLSSRQHLKKFKRPILAVAPGAKYGPTKKWGSERFIEIVKRFTKEYGSVVVFGNKSEGLKVEASYVYDFTGKTSVLELICLLSECDILVCNDSGVMHLGYALGVPLVAIFGSTSPEFTGPPKFAGKVVKANIHCSPCFRNSCDDVKCMKSIEVDDVWDAICKLLPKKKAVFFDRDGTLCKNANYLNRWQDFEVFSHIGEVKQLKEMGFLIIGVTNQSGIARGIVKEDFVKEVNRFFIDKYSFDDFFYCPHHPDDKCFCRKPNPQMPIMARYKYGIDFKTSYVVGDKHTDIELAQMIGAKGILVGKDARDLKEVVRLIKRDLNA